MRTGRLNPAPPVFTRYGFTSAPNESGLTSRAPRGRAAANRCPAQFDFVLRTNAAGFPTLVNEPCLRRI